MEQQQSGAHIGRRAFGGIVHDQGLISWEEGFRGTGSGVTNPWRRLENRWN